MMLVLRYDIDNLSSTQISRLYVSKTLYWMRKRCFRESSRAKSQLRHGFLFETYLHLVYSSSVNVSVGVYGNKNTVWDFPILQ